MASGIFTSSEEQLLQEDLECLRALEMLNDIPPLEGLPSTKYKVKGGGIEAIIMASSFYEAAMRVVFVLEKCHIPILPTSSILCETSHSLFEYSVRKRCSEGFSFPGVVLKRKTMLEDIQEDLEDHVIDDDVSVPSSSFVDIDINLHDPQTSTNDFVHAILKNVFGHDHFKPGQKETIMRTMSGKNTLSIMGTGGGKSLTFMLPASVSSKVTVVISPIRSLIEDLFDRSQHLDITSCMFLGNMEESYISQQITNLDKYKIIYMTPEMLNDHFIDHLSHLDNEDKLGRIVFDEAHTISTWGSTFRPRYKEVAEQLATFNAPKLLLSATVPLKLQEELKGIFGKDSWEVIANSVYRDNLTLKVIERGPKFMEDLSTFVEGHKEECGIIYCVLPKDVSKIHGDLRKKNIESVIYHGQLANEIKASSFDKWMSGQVNLIIANSSFGMGIDKPNVRYVIHAKMPTSLEEYFQQCGRAGRDDYPSMCVLYYNYSDKSLLYKLFKSQGNFDMQCAVLNELTIFLENPAHCRHKLIMNYFGENREEFTCQRNCDNCCHNGSFFSSDGTTEALKVVQTLVELGNTKVTCNTLKLILNGSRQKILLENNFDQLNNFGCLSKKFTPPILLDKFLHLLIHSGILGEDVQSLRNSFSVRVQLGAKAHNLLALDLPCLKYVKF